MLSRLAFLCRSIQLPRPARPTDAAKELEASALGHHLAVLHRQTPRPKLALTDRALLAASSRVLPRSSLVEVPSQAGDAAGLAPTAGRRRLNLPAAAHSGPPPLDRGVRAADHPAGQGEPRAGAPARQGRTPAAGHPGSRRPPSARRCVGRGWIPRHGGQLRPGGRSCANRPPGSWPVALFTVDRMWLRRLEVKVVHRTGDPAGPCGRRDRQPGRPTGSMQARNRLLAAQGQRPRVSCSTTATPTSPGPSTRCSVRRARRPAHAAAGTQRQRLLPALDPDGAGRVPGLAAECRARAPGAGLRVSVEHDNGHRPHRALGLEPPDPPANLSVVRDGPPNRVHQRDRLGGLLHEYHRRAT